MLQFIKKYRSIIIVVTIVIIIVLVIVGKQILKNQTNKWQDLSSPKDTFEKQEKELKLVEFGSDTCGVCEEMEPLVNQIREEYQKDLDFEYVDTNVKYRLAEEYNIMFLPTFMIIDQNGKVISRHTGRMSYDEFVTFIKGAEDTYARITKSYE